MAVPPGYGPASLVLNPDQAVPWASVLDELRSGCPPPNHEIENAPGKGPSGAVREELSLIDTCV